MEKKKVMVVDDNHDVVKMLTGKLEIGGFSVVAAYSGAEVLSKIDEEKPDLILSDIMMPGLDGNELIERLRLNQRWKNIPVIFVTALKTAQEDQAGERIGNNMIFPKPFDSDKLIKAIRELI